MQVQNGTEIKSGRSSQQNMSQAQVPQVQVNRQSRLERVQNQKKISIKQQKKTVILKPQVQELKLNTNIQQEQFREEIGQKLIFYSPEIRRQNLQFQSPDLQSPNSTTIKKCFTPFKDLTQDQDKFFRTCDKFNFKNNSTHKKTLSLMEHQLKHNTSQMKNIEKEIVFSRTTQFNTIQHQILKQKLKQKRFDSKVKVTERLGLPKAEQIQNPNQSQQQVRQFVNLDKLKGKKEDNDQDGDPFDQNAFFKWFQINYTTIIGRPSFKEGSQMVQYKNKIYLFGGISERFRTELYQFDIKNQKWSVQPTYNNSQIQGRMGHTCNIWNNYMILYGGEGDFNQRQKSRTNYNSINLLNLDTFEWQNFNTSITVLDHRRNHSTAIIGNFFYIIGGINTQEQYLKTMFQINLENGRCKEFQIPIELKRGIAFQQSYSVYKKNLIPLGKQKFQRIKEEGLYIFGGKNQVGKCFNSLYIIKPEELGRYMEFKPTKVLGEPPCKRYSFVIDYIQVDNSLVLYGGTDNQNRIFNDVWFLRLSTLTWVNVNIHGDIERNRYNHCGLIYMNKFYIYGGITQNENRVNSFTTWNLFYLDLDPKRSAKKDNEMEIYINFPPQKQIESPFEDNPEDFNIEVEKPKKFINIRNNTKDIFQHLVKSTVNNSTNLLSLFSKKKSVSIKQQK